MRYFAYGSNLLTAELQRHCPGARPLVAATLPDHRRDFTRYSPRRGGGVVDIVPAPGAQVRGAIYDVPEQDWAALDRKEHVAAGGYERVAVELSVGTERLLATTYRVVAPVPPIAPTAEYLELIVAGLRAWRIPDDEAHALRARAHELGTTGPAGDGDVPGS